MTEASLVISGVVIIAVSSRVWLAGRNNCLRTGLSAGRAAGSESESADRDRQRILAGGLE